MNNVMPNNYLSYLYMFMNHINSLNFKRRHILVACNIVSLFISMPVKDTILPIMFIKFTLQRNILQYLLRKIEGYNLERVSSMKENHTVKLTY